MQCKGPHNNNNKNVKDVFDSSMAGEEFYWVFNA